MVPEQHVVKLLFAASSGAHGQCLHSINHLSDVVSSELSSKHHTMPSIRAATPCLLKTLPGSGQSTEGSSFRRYNTCPVLVLPPLCRHSPGCVTMEIPSLPLYYWAIHSREGSGCFSAPRGLSEDLSLRYTHSDPDRQKFWKTWGTRHFRENSIFNWLAFLLLTYY